MSALFKYYQSLAGGPPSSHTVRQAIQLIIGAVFAGYTATALPPKFLKLFEKPVYQFLIFLVLFNQNYWNETGFPRWYMFMDAFLSTFALQLLIYVTKKFYPPEEKPPAQD